MNVTISNWFEVEVIDMACLKLFIFVICPNAVVQAAAEICHTFLKID